MSCVLENIVSCERMFDMSFKFGHKMAAGNEVVNGNNFGLALVMTSATFSDVHAGCQIWETERCKPFNVYKVTIEVGGPVMTVVMLLDALVDYLNVDKC